MYDIICYRELILTEKTDNLGKNVPLCLYHNSFLQNFGSVSLIYFNGLLKDDFAAVGDFIYEVYRCTRNLHTVLESLFVNVKSVEALTTEGGDK